MRRIPRAKLVVEERQRQGADHFDPELAASIRTLGLLHPIVVAYRNATDDWRLVAGGRRLSAIDHMAGDGLYFLCDGETVLPGEVPTITVSEVLTPLELREAEFEENFIRKDLPWQDRIKALADIHRERQKLNEQQTVTDTATELAARGGVAGGATTVRGLRQGITQAVIIDKHISDPAVRNARNEAEAFQLAIDRSEVAFRAEIARRQNAAMDTARAAEQPGPVHRNGGGADVAPTILRQAERTVHVIHGSSFTVLPTLEEGRFDLILGDPPFGVNAGAPGFRARTVHHHNYEDTPDAAKQLIQCIFSEGFRCTKPRANIFLCTDIDLWPWLQVASSAAGWVPFRTPIIWQKSHSEGLAPWGRQGPRRTYEMVFFATKGGRGLIHSPIDVLDHPRVPRHTRDYGPAKPPSLMQELIECSTIPGDSVLDPCCGSGATLVAALATNRRALGIEQDEHAAQLALLKLVEPPATFEPNPPVMEPDLDAL